MKKENFPKTHPKSIIARIFWQLHTEMALETIDFSGGQRDRVEMAAAH